MNARRAPEGIGEGHGADELGDLRIDGRATGSTASRLPVPERAEALPVPANHGLRLNDIERFAPPCPPLREPHPEDASRRPTRGRLERRRSRASCCRSARFSRTRSVRAFSAARRVLSRANTRDIATQARLTGDPHPAWRPTFWPTTGGLEDWPARRHGERLPATDRWRTTRWKPENSPARWSPTGRRSRCGRRSRPPTSRTPGPG